MRRHVFLPLSNSLRDVGRKLDITALPHKRVDWSVCLFRWINARVFLSRGRAHETPANRGALKVQRCQFTWNTGLISGCAPLLKKPCELYQQSGGRGHVKMAFITKASGNRAGESNKFLTACVGSGLDSVWFNAYWLFMVPDTNRFALMSIISAFQHKFPPHRAEDAEHILMASTI